MSIASFMDLPAITQAAIAAITLLTLWLGVFRYNILSITYGPTILTMIGIFGCFLGIAIGLMHFDTSNVQGSVPALLAGIKTSFWSSVVGIGGALTIKLRLLLLGPPKSTSDGEIQGATIDDLANLLANLHTSLAGEADATLLGQVRLMRQESHNGLDTLNASLENFLKTTAENNSKALIQALQEVIRDFNAKINEQFGDNFKQLNAAVEKILVWQEKYREQVDEMIVQQQTCANSMTEAAQSYKELVGNAKGFTEVSTALKSILSGLEVQKTQLRASLESLAKLIVSAANGLPKIEVKILEMTKQIESGVRANNEQWASAFKAVTETVQGSHGELKQLLINTVRSANQELNTHVRQMSDQTRQQVLALDKALEKGLNDSLESLGRQLTALSQKFVEDYSPLTDRLRQVVQMSRAVA
ncbi:MAG: hypothetical protein WAN51_00860 [Alphaproteobacteria bacterium]